VEAIGEVAKPHVNGFEELKYQVKLALDLPYNVVFAMTKFCVTDSNWRLG